MSRRDYWTSRCCVTQAVLTAPGSCLECRIRTAIPNPTITATTAIAVHSMRSSRVCLLRSDCITPDCRPECQRSGGRARGQGRRVDTAWEGARLRLGAAGILSASSQPLPASIPSSVFASPERQRRSPVRPDRPASLNASGSRSEGPSSDPPREHMPSALWQVPHRLRGPAIGGRA